MMLICPIANAEVDQENNLITIELGEPVFDHTATVNDVTYPIEITNFFAFK